jgi:hypothetical protein
MFGFADDEVQEALHVKLWLVAHQYLIFLCIRYATLSSIGERDAVFTSIANSRLKRQCRLVFLRSMEIMLNPRSGLLRVRA